MFICVDLFQVYTVYYISIQAAAYLEAQKGV